jgi:hypothetical protein
VPENSASLPDFTRWPSFPFEGDMRIKRLAAPVDVEPPRSGEDAGDCVACNTPDDAYIWVSERWRVRAMDRPTGLPMVLILECRSHLDLGDLPNLLAAELGVMTVRLERAIRTLDEVARVHVNRWGDGSAHLHMWFLARPYGRLQLRGTFLSLWDDILPVIPEQQWRGNLALVAAWLAEFGGHANAEPPHIQWQSPGSISDSPDASSNADFADDSAGSTSSDSPGVDESVANPWRPADLADVEESEPDSRSDDAPIAEATADLAGSAARADALHASRAVSESPDRDHSRDATGTTYAGGAAAAGANDGSASASREADVASSDLQEEAASGEASNGDGPPNGDGVGSKSANGGATETPVVETAAVDSDTKEGAPSNSEALDDGAAAGGALKGAKL